MKLDILVKNIVGKYIHLSWDTVPATATSYRIWYSREEVITNDWEELGTTTNQYYTDYINFDHSILNRRITYKVDALLITPPVNPGDDPTETVLDQVIFTTDTQDKELLSRTLNVLSRDAEIALRNNQWSKEAFILKPRKSGTYCTCWSRDIKASAKPNCPTCYGKGYVGGFYYPMHSYALVLEEEVKNRTVNERKPTTYDVITAVMPSFPQVREDDYIYIKNIGIFFVMKSTTRTVLGSHSPTSLITMSLLKPDNVVYSYPISDTVTTVTSIAQDGATHTDFIVTGTNLMPYFGEFKLILSNVSDYSEYGVFLFDKVIAVTDTAITIRTDIAEALSSYSYRLRLNGLIFSGTVL